MTTVGTPRSAAARTRPGVARRAGVLREPAYVLCFTAGLLFNVLSGNSKLVGFPIGPDRLLFGAALVLVLADPDALRRTRLRWRTVHTLLVAMVLLTMLSAITVGTLTTQFGLYALLDRLVVPFVAFTLGPVIYATEQRRVLLLRTLTCLGIYLGATAVFEVVGPHALVFPRYIMDPDVGIQFGRARGPFAESEADGLTMIACGFSAALLAARTAGRWRVAGVVGAVLCLAGVFLTETRSVWLGAGIGVVAAGLLVPRLRRLLPLALAGVAMLVTVALLASPQLRSGVAGRAGDRRSLYDRQNVNAAAIRVLEAHPLTGIGWVEFESQGSEYVRQDPNYPITNVGIEVHNVFLGRAAELGVPGGVLFAACVLAGPARAVVRRRRGLSAPLPDEPPDAWGIWLVYLGTASGWLVSSLGSPLPYPLPNLLLWLLAGMVLTPYLTVAPRRATPTGTAASAPSTAGRPVRRAA